MRLRARRGGPQRGPLGRVARDGFARSPSASNGDSAGSSTELVRAPTDRGARDSEDLLRRARPTFPAWGEPGPSDSTYARIVVTAAQLRFAPAGSIGIRARGRVGAAVVRARPRGPSWLTGSTTIVEAWLAAGDVRGCCGGARPDAGEPRESADFPARGGGRTLLRGRLGARQRDRSVAAAGRVRSTSLATARLVAGKGDPLARGRERGGRRARRGRRRAQGAAGISSRFRERPEHEVKRLVRSALRHDRERDGRARLELRHDARQVVDGGRPMSVDGGDHVAWRRGPPSPPARRL